MQRNAKPASQPSESRSGQRPTSRRRAAPRLWDISQRLRPDLPVWPGDVAFDARQSAAIGGDCVVNIHHFAMSTQAGTHAEAPLHFEPRGRAIHELALERFIGRCTVVAVPGPRQYVEPDDVLPHLAPDTTRVLLKTLGEFAWDRWPDDTAGIHPTTIEALAERGVVLIGTDAPSVDPQTSKQLLAHHAISRHGLAILEGLVLARVAAGDYELIALPLNIQNVEAAPVRAVLRELAE